MVRTLAALHNRLKGQKPHFHKKIYLSIYISIKTFFDRVHTEDIQKCWLTTKRPEFWVNHGISWTVTLMSWIRCVFLFLKLIGAVKNGWY